jgi:hypothetical protein
LLIQEYFLKRKVTYFNIVFPLKPHSLSTRPKRREEEKERKKKRKKERKKDRNY